VYLPGAALAAVAAMLAAGMFEYNFGDSEFLMLFLVIVTLPFVAARPDHAASTRHPERASRASPAVLVIGDAMLDKFIVGRVTRISPRGTGPCGGYDHELCIDLTL
jgi:hypothetical protein